MFRDTNSLVKAGALISFFLKVKASITWAILALIETNTLETINTDVRPTARNNSGSQHQKTFLSNELGPWKTIVLLPISLPASATSQLVCSLRWAAVFLGFSPLSSNSRGRVPHFIRLSLQRRTSASRDKPSGWSSWAPGISLDGFEWCLHECNVKTFEVFISKWMTKVKINYGHLLNSNGIKRRKVLLLLQYACHLWPRLRVSTLETEVCIF